MLLSFFPPPAPSAPRFLPVHLNQQASQKGFYTLQQATPASPPPPKLPLRPPPRPPAKESRSWDWNVSPYWSEPPIPPPLRPPPPSPPRPLPRPILVYNIGSLSHSESLAGLHFRPTLFFFPVLVLHILYYEHPMQVLIHTWGCCCKLSCLADICLFVTSKIHKNL